MSGLWAARGGATSAAAQDWLGPKADAARLMAADDGEDFREALITPVFQELAYVSAQRLNPWFQPWMYTKATDFMLDVVDGLEEGFAASSEGLVCLATGILLRYLGAHAIDSSKLEVTANLCLTIASKFNERMYVPLSRGAKHDVIEPSTGTVVARSALELEVLDRLGWRLNVVTPYALKRAALEAVLEQHELDATPEIYAQCWCAARLPAWPPQYPPSTLDDCARNFSGAIVLSARRLPSPPRSKRFDVYLYLAIRDSKYLALRDQGAALAAATDLALPPSLRKPCGGADAALADVCERLGVTDVAAGREMRALMLDVAEVCQPTKQKGRADSPDNITTTDWL